MHKQQSPHYIGRFAPSPTGPVHFGTLVAAVGSYLQAKTKNGDWLIRMEDVDTTRKVTNADKTILNTLEAFGFSWHGQVLYQTEQLNYYQQALEKLQSLNLTFPCLCSRKQIVETNSGIYPGTCRKRTHPEIKHHAIRIMAKDISISFEDLVTGTQSQNIKSDCGDFIIKRRDGLFAYQLAVVVDDAIQGITEIVRGADLLDSTPRQIYLQQLLGLESPRYCHLPLAIDASGNKVSKSEGNSIIDIDDKEKLLLHALDFLGQQTDSELQGCSIDDIWQWAIVHWDINKVPAGRKMPTPQQAGIVG